MKRTLEFAFWFIAAFAVALSLLVHGHPLFQVGDKAIWFDVAAVNLVLAVITYERWLSRLRLATNGYMSQVPGHEGMCFHYWGQGGFMQSGKHLFGPVYYMSGVPFLGTVHGTEVKEFDLFTARTAPQSQPA